MLKYFLQIIFYLLESSQCCWWGFCNPWGHRMAPQSTKMDSCTAQGVQPDLHWRHWFRCLVLITAHLQCWFHIHSNGTLGAHSTFGWILRRGLFYFQIGHLGQRCLLAVCHADQRRQCRQHQEFTVHNHVHWSRSSPGAVSNAWRDGNFNQQQIWGYCCEACAQPLAEDSLLLLWPLCAVFQMNGVVNCFLFFYWLK